MQNAMLIIAVLQTALLRRALVRAAAGAWKGLEVVKAVFFSAAAALINWRAFLPTAWAWRCCSRPC
jgi:hypothetical protein